MFIGITSRFRLPRASGTCTYRVPILFHYSSSGPPLGQPKADGKGIIYLLLHGSSTPETSYCRVSSSSWCTYCVIKMTWYWNPWTLSLTEVQLLLPGLERLMSEYMYTLIRHWEMVLAYGQRTLWPAWTETKAWLHPRFVWCHVLRNLNLTFTTFGHLSDNRGTSEARAHLEGRWNQELKTDKGYLKR